MWPLSRTLVETLYLVAGLVVAGALTYAIAWAYPLGATTAWWCGGTAMVATVLMGIGPLRRARAQDRSR